MYVHTQLSQSAGKSICKTPRRKIYAGQQHNTNGTGSWQLYVVGSILAPDCNTTKCIHALVICSLRIYTKNKNQHSLRRFGSELLQSQYVGAIHSPNRTKSLLQVSSMALVLQANFCWGRKWSQNRVADHSYLVFCDIYTCSDGCRLTILCLPVRLSLE